MKLIIAGCDYAGKTSLAKKVVEWMHSNLSARYADDVPLGAHDHFTFPNPELPPDEREKLLLLGPKAREQYQRYMITYHLEPSFMRDDPDLVLVGFHFTEAVYPPMYYGYGEPGAYAERSLYAREVENRVNELDAETVLVFLKATPEVVRERMKAHPSPDSPLLEPNVDRAVAAFEHEYNSCFIRRRFMIDTSDTSPDQMFDQWLRTMESGYFTQVDWLRILGRRQTR